MCRYRIELDSEQLESAIWRIVGPTKNTNTVLALAQHMVACTSCAFVLVRNMFFAVTAAAAAASVTLSFHYPLPPISTRLVLSRVHGQVAEEDGPSVVVVPALGPVHSDALALYIRAVRQKRLLPRSRR